MDTLTSLEQRISRLEATEAIRQLVARYAFAVDDRDMRTLRGLFTADARFHSKNGATSAQGIDEVMGIYEARFQGMKHAFHAAHDHVIEFLDEENARGRVASHAELSRDGEPYLVALRYHDLYALEQGNWRFRERELSFYYYVKASEYFDAMRGTDRVRSGGAALPADWPEQLDTFLSYSQAEAPGGS